MKILIIGNHSCGNRGDGAILRGLIEEFERSEHNIELDLVSRFPVSSEILIGREFFTDWLYRYKEQRKGLRGKIENKLFKNRIFKQLMVSARHRKANTKLPEEFKRYIKSLEKYDYIVQVGGSFFVDLYGLGQFYHALCALTADKPLLMLGHSVGPFESNEFCEAAQLVFSRAKVFGLRETVSKLLLEEKFELPENYVRGADTAWLVDSAPLLIENPNLTEYVNKSKTVAITLRELKPFDKRLGVSQAEYEDSFANLCSSLIDMGYNILACSTCTGIEGYQKDDRMIAFRVGKKVNNPEKYKVVMDEINDVELGSLLSQCELTIGTRLHSAIISMNFGTPAFALNYEHKSEGIMNQLGLGSFGIPLSELIDGTLLDKVKVCLENIESVREKVEKAVSGERERARRMVSLSFR